MRHLSRLFASTNSACFAPSLSSLCRSLGGSVIDTSGWQPTIGLEIHAQLTSASTKLFSSAPYSFANPPNTQIEPLDAAIPGTMPIINRTCIESAILAALGLNCRVNTVSRFERKHYFYSDSPSGYQITQQEWPIAQNGYLDYLWVDKESPRVGRATIQRIQLEQDTGKSLHDEKNARSLIDLNRAGVGLIEVVTQPDFSCGFQAAAFVEELGCLLAHLSVCTANLSTGQLRVDCNISIGPDICSQGPIVEVKNVNSLRGIRYAVDYEINRQYAVVQCGGTVINETRLFDASASKTTPMRDKEVVQDYRFLPEPNLPLLRLIEECPSCVESSSGNRDGHQVCIGCIKKAAAIQRSLLPGAVRRELVFGHLLSPDRAAVLISNPPLLTLYNEALLQTVFDVKVVRKETAYWCTGLLFSLFQRYGKEKLPLASQLAEFVAMNLSGTLHGPGAEKVISLMCESQELSGSVQEFVQANLPDCLLTADAEVIRPICRRFVKNHEKQMKNLTTLKFDKKKRKKLLQSLVHRLIASPEYRAKQFNPVSVERLLLEACSEYRPQD